VWVGEGGTQLGGEGFDQRLMAHFDQVRSAVACGFVGSSLLQLQVF
jgi:hypothetical protein